MNPRSADLKDQGPHRAFELQAEIAAAREETLKLEAARQQHFRDELSRLGPLQRLDRAIWLMKHEQAYGPFGTSMPLSGTDVASVQKAAVEHVRETLLGLEAPSERFEYVRTVILDLDLMQDEGDIIGPVRQKMVRILEYLEDEWAERATALQDAVRLAQAELETTENALRDRKLSETPGTATNWRHLARAAVILSRHPDLASKGALSECAQRMQAELGPAGEDPGGAIWRGIHRLGKTMLYADHLPNHYLRFEGFRRLVFDLIHGTLTPQNKKDKNRTRKTATGKKK